MGNANIVERHLSRLENNIDGFGFVDTCGNRLPACKHISFVVGILVREMYLMTAWLHTHAPTFDCRRRQGYPRRSNLSGIKAPVLVILVPGNILSGSWFFDPKMDTPTQNVWADEVFDRIKKSRIANQTIHPRQQQTGLDALRSL